MSTTKKRRGNAILIFIFLLPLLFIAIFSVSFLSNKLTFSNVRAITVSVPNESDITFDSQDDIDFFVNMLSGKISIKTALRDVSEEDPVDIIFIRDGNPLEYKLYPSLNLSSCLLVSPDNELFALENETAKQLLLRPEFDYLYSDCFLPDLAIKSGDETFPVYPTEAEWSYFKSDGVEYEYIPTQFATGEEVYAILKGKESQWEFAVTDILPEDKIEYYDIKCVTDDGKEYNISNIKDLNLSIDSMLDISFTAKWSSMNGAQGFGEAKYKFKLRYDIPAEIKIPDKGYTIGDFIEIYATHLNEDETVTLETLIDAPPLDFNVIKDDEGVALIPIGQQNAPGDYNIIINTGVEKIQGKVDVIPLPKENYWIPITPTEEQYSKYLTPEKIAAFRTAIEAATETRPEADYFVYGESEFIAPVEGFYVYSYGRSVNLSTVSSEGSGEYNCDGVVYELAEGTKVYAPQAGVVVYCGELDTTGKTVIVYHGYGIYSYYFHLDSTVVGEGYVLNQGNEIGVAGTSGFTADKTVLNYAISIDGIFVNPNNFGID